MFQTSERPELGLAFLQFLLIILFTCRVTFDGNLRERDTVQASVQLSVAKWIGVHFVFPAR